MLNQIMLLSAVAGTLALIGTQSMSGQILHPSGPLPSFEVATIRPWKPSIRPPDAPAPMKIDPTRVARRQETDRVHFIGQIDLLIMEAFNLPIGSDRRILNGPKWVDSEANRYEVDAKMEASTFTALQRMPPEEENIQIALLEQSLLAERFHLKVHFETQGKTPIYALTIAKDGPRLAPAKDGETTSLTSLVNDITARAVTLEQFAASPLWTPIGDRLVVDKTGLTGRYDFTLKWRRDSLDASVDDQEDRPPLFDAIREQLGLKVVDSTAPLEVIVIDHIDRPTVN